MPIPPGTSIGPYTVEAEIGRGCVSWAQKGEVQQLSPSDGGNGAAKSDKRPFSISELYPSVR